MNLVPWLLFLHVLGAIVAFGPSFAAPIIGGMGAKEPQHANFGLRLSATLVKRLTIPIAVWQGISGALLIAMAGWNLTEPRGRWLITSIVLYVIALGFATGVQSKRVAKLIDMTSKPRPADAPPGPPPAPVLALIKQVQQGGMILTVLIVTIVLLMVVKPTM